MTEYAPRRSSDLNHAYSGANLAISPYSRSSMEYINNGQLQYAQFGPGYPSYSMAYMPGQANNWVTMTPRHLDVATYQSQHSRATAVPSQPRTLPHETYYPQTLHSQPHLQQPIHYQLSREISLMETEAQDSINADTQRSEPITPPLEGYPNVDEFDRLMQHYVQNLSPKKQDKALIHAKRATNIKAVLIDKKTTQVESAQFRFWVKKMFTLQPCDPNIPASRKKICHDNKPVAIREKLFKILTRAHKECQHGGRDKTSAQVRKVYSWVPKELISRFVKICPTCQVRRGTTRDCDQSNVSSPEELDTDIFSASESRRTSITTPGSSAIHSPLQMSGFSSTFRHQNRWMTPLPHSDKADMAEARLEHATSVLGALHQNLDLRATSSPHLETSDEVDMAGYAATMEAASVMEVDSPSYYHQSMSGYHGYHGHDIHFRYKNDQHSEHGRPY